MLYNWRAMIGVIAPTTGVAIEADFHRFAPEGVATVTNRIPFSGNPTPGELMDMVDWRAPPRYSTRSFPLTW